MFQAYYVQDVDDLDQPHQAVVAEIARGSLERLQLFAQRRQASGLLGRITAPVLLDALEVVLLEHHQQF